jgi:hypothetical protein
MKTASTTKPTIEDYVQYVDLMAMSIDRSMKLAMKIDDKFMVIIFGTLYAIMNCGADSIKYIDMLSGFCGEIAKEIIEKNRGETE